MDAIAKRQKALGELADKYVNKGEVSSLEAYHDTVEKSDLALRLSALIKGAEKSSNPYASPNGVNASANQNIGIEGQSAENLKRRLVQAFEVGNARQLSEVKEEARSFAARKDAQLVADFDNSKVPTRLPSTRRSSQEPRTLPQKLLTTVGGRFLGEKNKQDGSGKDSDKTDTSRTYIAIIAWLVAIIGMLIAMAFLVADFWVAQSHPSQVFDFTSEDTIDLPAITFCSGYFGVPSFENFPTNEYPGHAIFAIRSYTNTETNQSLMWPDAQKAFRSVYIGANSSQCATEMTRMSMTRGFRPPTPNTRECVPCFQLGTTPSKIPIRKPGPANRTYLPVSVTVAASELARLCFSKSTIDTLALDTLNAEIEKHLSQLQARGIIDTSGMNYKIAFGQFRQFFYDGNLDLYFREVSSFLCSIYFFSGYFYPAAPADIRYRFSTNTMSWLKIGNGPYHGVNISSPVVMSPLKELEHNSDVNFRSKLFAFVNDPDKASAPGHEIFFRNRVAIFDAYEPYSLLFEKRVERGESIYDTKVIRNTKVISSAASVYSKWDIFMDFQNFNVATILERPATSVWEFLSDIVELAGLFTGVCAYSLIVAPAQRYLKKTQAPQEKK